MVAVAGRAAAAGIRRGVESDLGVVDGKYLEQSGAAERESETEQAVDDEGEVTMASKYTGMQSNPSKYGTPHKPAPSMPAGKC